ncbi:unnamed protein product, partial [Polarella glacialis]
DLRELAIYGFCSGNYDALMPACGVNWADRCWGELHCVKEWLIERLLEDGRAEWTHCGFCSGCDSSGSCCCRLGEGDGGCADAAESDQLRALRAEKLCGRMPPSRSSGVNGELESAVRVEVQQLLRRLLPPGAGIGADIGTDWHSPATVASRFSQLQAVLIETAWAPEQGETALNMLRQWLGGEGGGDAGGNPPFLVKQFASYFAIWQKELLDEATALDDAGRMESSEPQAFPGAGFSAFPGAGAGAGAGAGFASGSDMDVDVDDIVGELVRELVLSASGPNWAEQCLRGQALQLVAEHAAALRPARRLEAFAVLLLRLGHSSGGGAGAAAAAGSLSRRGDGTNAQAEVMMRCIWVFWGRFPDEVFALLAVLVRRALHLDDETAAETVLPSIGPAGVRAAADPEDLSLVVLSLLALWVVARDKAQEGTTVAEAMAGLEQLVGRPVTKDAQAETQAFEHIR